MMWLCYIIMIVVPYLLGGVNTSIIVTKLKTGKDIRTMGSGNAGLTNTLRHPGQGGCRNSTSRRRCKGGPRDLGGQASRSSSSAALTPPYSKTT